MESAVHTEEKAQHERQSMFITTKTVSLIAFIIETGGILLRSEAAKMTCTVEGQCPKSLPALFANFMPRFHVRSRTNRPKELHIALSRKGD
jgi:hypothetical protein